MDYAFPIILFITGILLGIDINVIKFLKTKRTCDECDITCTPKRGLPKGSKNENKAGGRIISRAQGQIIKRIQSGAPMTLDDIVNDEE